MTVKRTLIIAIVSALATTQAWGEEKDPVAATVDGYEIHLSDVVDARELLPAQMQGQPMRVVYPMLLDSLINSRLAAKKARAMGLDDTPEFKSRMARISEQLLERTLLTKHIEENLTDELLQERYTTYSERLKGQEEVHARHILVKAEDEAKAKDLIVKLQAGEDFAALAKEHSTGPSGPEGGDLGWFGPGRMVPAFENAAMALAAGDFTTAPVKSQFGWHVIKVDERRPVTVPSFEDAKSNLANEVLGELGQAMMDDLRKDAKVDKVDLEALQ